MLKKYLYQTKQNLEKHLPKATFRKQPHNTITRPYHHTTHMPPGKNKKNLEIYYKTIAFLFSVWL
jgi:hypothetical protein